MGLRGGFLERRELSDEHRLGSEGVNDESERVKGDDGFENGCSGQGRAIHCWRRGRNGRPSLEVTWTILWVERTVVDKQGWVGTEGALEGVGGYRTVTNRYKHASHILVLTRHSVAVIAWERSSA